METILPILLIAIGGAVGSLARYGLGGLVQGNRMGFPIGTLVVNMLGCLAMGLLARWLKIGLAGPQLRLLFGIGFLGGFTTFSTFSLEALNLLLDRNLLTALIYIGGSLFGSLLAVTLGYLTARAIWG